MINKVIKLNSSVKLLKDAARRPTHPPYSGWIDTLSRYFSKPSQNFSTEYFKMFLIAENNVLHSSRLTMFTMVSPAVLIAPSHHSGNILEISMSMAPIGISSADWEPRLLGFDK